MLTFGGPAWAQLVPDALPGAADGGRIEERVPEAPLIEADEPEKPADMPDIPQQVDDVPDGTVLKKVIIEGNTVFSDAELARFYAPYLSHRVNHASLERVAATITKFYRAQGYFLSSAVVPRQSLANGTARIVVIEGYVTELQVESSMPRDDLFSLVRKVRKRILAMRPLHAARLEETMLLLNDVEAIRSTAVIRLPKQEAPPGAVAMVLKIEPQQPHGSVAINNHGSRYTGPLQATGTVGLSPGLLGYDYLQVSGLSSLLPADEVHFLSARYSVPITTHGTKLAVNVGFSDTAPGYLLKPSEVKGRTWDAGFAVTQSLLRSRAENASAEARLDFKNASTDTLGTVLFRDRIRALRLGFQFDNQDAWKGSNYLNGTISQGLDFLGSRESGTINLSRAEGRSDFTKAELFASRLQYLDETWQVYGSASGQYAFTPLLSSEEFGFGGLYFGRAYDPSEILGDRGFAASIEARYTGIPVKGDITFQPYGFYDLGKVWNIDNVGGGSDSASSAGVGIRARHESGLSADIYGAFPLTKATGAPLYGSNGKGVRMGFDLGYDF